MSKYEEMNVRHGGGERRRRRKIRKKVNRRERCDIKIGFGQWVGSPFLWTVVVAFVLSYKGCLLYLERERENVRVHLQI